MSDITVLDRIIEEVRHIASDDPTHVYQPPGGEGYTCSYLTSGDQPGQGCIMGQALIHVGVSPDALVAVEGESIATVIQKLGLFTDEHDLDANARKRWLNWVQNRQDSGTTWSAAVQDADAMYRGVAR